MHWEIKLNPPQSILPMDNDWPREKLDLPSCQLNSMLNGSMKFVTQ